MQHIITVHIVVVVVAAVVVVVVVVVLGVGIFCSPVIKCWL